MDRAELDRVWAAFSDLQFPESPQDPDLGEWIMELLEIDGFYAGIATTVLGGGRSAFNPRPDELTELGERLDKLRVATPDDETILGQCRTYFAVLKRLHEVLLS